MQNVWPPLLYGLVLLGAAIVIVVQSWRLGRQRRVARANEAASVRESERRLAARARILRAGDGEQDAALLLLRHGYAVVERQVSGSWTVRADGEPFTFGLRADYLVVRHGRRYIAEVKTGRLAPRLAHGPTRRQLLEYSAAFDVHGVILVDADAETLTHVEVDGRRGVAPRVFACVAVMSFFVGTILGTATMCFTRAGVQVFETLSRGTRNLRSDERRVSSGAATCPATARLR